jgi:hypothetical protein
MNKKYIVELTSEECSQLRQIVQAARICAHKRRHAQMLLKLDQGPAGPAWSDAQVAEAFDCTARSAERLRQRLVERGFEQALEHGNRGAYRVRRLDGKAEAHLIALTRLEPPKGQCRWTVRLLAEQMVTAGYVDRCGKTTVHDTLKKMSLNLT